MAKLLGRLLRSPRARARLRVLTAVLFGLVAVLSWWGIITEGHSTARVIGAIASSIVFVLEAFLPKRRRFLRRSRVAPGPE